MNELFINILGTIIGGLILTVILFFSNETLFSRKNLSGVWTASIKIEKTSYNPYKDLCIEYKIHILQQGSVISGSGEKIKDINQDGTTTVFEPEKRVQIEFTGHYEKKYFKKSTVYLNLIEEGRRRETRTTYSLVLITKNKLSGVFDSTAANSLGTVEITRI